MTRELAFTDLEAQIVSIARLMSEEKIYFTAMAGPPLFGVLLGKRMYAPGLTYLVEEGAIGPSPNFPLPRMMLGGAQSHYRSVAWDSMNTVDAHLSLGYADYGVLNAVQVDKFGNFNSTFLGSDYNKPERRFGGPGGANEIASMSWQTIIQTRLDPRKFVERCDFSSSPGYIDGTPGARERAGLPAGTGPWKVVTERAIFGFDEESHLMRLDAIAPWITVDEVLARMQFKPLIADKLDVLEPPTDEELTIIRAEIDPGGFTLARGEWLSVTLPD